MNLRKVGFIKGCTWKENIILSAVLFKKRKLLPVDVESIAYYTETSPAYCKKVLDKNCNPGIIIKAGDQYRLNEAALANPLSDLVKRVKDKKHPMYIRVGKRGNACPLTPSENYLYFWWRRNIKMQHCTQEKILNYNRMAASTYTDAMRGLVRKGCLKQLGDELSVVDVDFDKWYPDRKHSGRPKINNLSRFFNPKPPVPRAKRKPRVETDIAARVCDVSLDEIIEPVKVEPVVEPEFDEEEFLNDLRKTLPNH